MCRKVACRSCGKATWAGCGAHVDQVMAGVPAGQRCVCTDDDRAAARTSSGGFFARLFGG